MTECPNCGAPAPDKQIENLGICERCQVNRDEETVDNNNGETRADLIEKWKN
jgi:hypothetical protein